MKPADNFEEMAEALERAINRDTIISFAALIGFAALAAFVSVIVS